MFKVNKNLFIFTFLVAWCFSCYREPIDIDLSEIDHKIVIEGGISDQLGAHTVKISRTVDFSASNPYQVVTGAKVSIYDNEGNIEILQETRPGIYQTRPIRGVIGKKYTLKVKVDGKEYSATSTMVEALELKTFDLVQHPYFNDMYKLICSFNDREGIDDFCYLKIYVNGYEVDDYIYQGKLTDGEEIILDDFGFLCNRNDEILVELSTFEEAIHDYVSSLDRLLEREDEEDDIFPIIFEMSYYNPVSNINNGALGFFAAFTLRRYWRVVN